MPAPTADSINAFLTNAFLAAGLVDKTYVDGAATPTTPPQLAPATALLVKAISQGLAQQWLTWELSTVVSIPVTASAGSPSTGVLL